MKSLDLEHIRLIAVGLVSPLLAYITPTKGFVIALVIAFGANVICGMVTVLYSSNKISSVTV